MNPAIAEVILIGESLAASQMQVANRHGAGVSGEIQAAVLADAVLATVDIEAMEVQVFRMRSINRVLFIDADQVQGLSYEVGSAMFQGSSAS
ncbi:hypothetical protein QTI24_29920 [Variovorax sp. J22P240]|nr:hypothetical protein [Variovorax sp. J22P240]MDM0002840.1 hypothetical protein [Variovorax sp. J22P240]